MAMVFQDPMTSLNPFLPVWVQISEVTRAASRPHESTGARACDRMLEAVGIPDARSQSGPLSASILRRYAAACDDRDGLGLPAEAAHRR